MAVGSSAPRAERVQTISPSKSGTRCTCALLRHPPRGEAGRASKGLLINSSDHHPPSPRRGFANCRDMRAMHRRGSRAAHVHTDILNALCGRSQNTAVSRTVNCACPHVVLGIPEATKGGPMRALEAWRREGGFPPAAARSWDALSSQPFLKRKPAGRPGCGKWETGNGGPNALYRGYQYCVQLSRLGLGERQAPPVRVFSAAAGRLKGTNQQVSWEFRLCLAAARKEERA